MHLRHLPSDLLVYVATFLSYRSVLSLSAIFRGSNQLLASNVIWQPLYSAQFAIYSLGPRSLHIYPGCYTTPCHRKGHYRADTLIRSPVRRQYRNYKKQFARRMHTADKCDIAFIRNASVSAEEATDIIDSSLQGINVQLQRLLSRAADLIQRRSHFVRLAALINIGLDQVYKWVLNDPPPQPPLIRQTPRRRRRRERTVIEQES